MNISIIVALLCATVVVSARVKHGFDSTGMLTARVALEDKVNLTKDSSRAAPKTGVLTARVALEDKVNLTKDSFRAAPKHVGFIIYKTHLQYAGLFYVSFAILYFLKTWLVDVPWAEDYSMLKQLRKSFESSMSNWTDRLQVIKNTESISAESTFLQRYEEFQMHLSSFACLVSENKAAMDAADFQLAEPFKDFMKGWLKLLRQCKCNPDPVQEPYEIWTCNGAIESMTRMSEITEHIGRQLQDRQLSVLAGDVEQFRATHLQRATSLAGKGSRKKKFWVTARCGIGFGISTYTQVGDGDRAPFPLVIDFCCIRMEILSPWHCRLLFYLFFGVGLMVALFGAGDIAFALLVGSVVWVTMVLLLLLVNTVDDYERLVLDANRMNTQMQEAEQDLRLIEAASERTQQVMDLWRWQTLPRLELYALAMGSMLRALPQDLNAIRHIADQMQYVEDSYGALDLWLGQRALPPSFMQAAARQLTGRSQRLAEGAASDPSTELGLRGYFAIVAVVVLTAHSLPDRDGPCVVVKVGKEQHRTKTLQGDSKPDWGGEKFLLLAAPVDMVLRLEVHDQDDGRATDGYAAVGAVEVPFRTQPGEWVQKKEQLRSLSADGKLVQGEVEFRFLFASSMKELENAR